MIASSRSSSIILQQDQEYYQRLELILQVQNKSLGLNYFLDDQCKLALRFRCYIAKVMEDVYVRPTNVETLQNYN